MNYKDREPAARRLVADLIGSKEIVIHKELTAPKTIYFTGHLESPRRDIADGRLDVVRDPLHKVGRVLLLGSGLRIRTRIYCKVGSESGLNTQMRNLYIIDLYAKYFSSNY